MLHIYMHLERDRVCPFPFFTLQILWFHEDFPTKTNRNCRHFALAKCRLGLYFPGVLSTFCAWWLKGNCACSAPQNCESLLQVGTIGSTGCFPRRNWVCRRGEFVLSTLCPEAHGWLIFSCYFWYRITHYNARAQSSCFSHSKDSSSKQHCSFFIVKTALKLFKFGSIHEASSLRSTTFYNAG